MAFLMCDEEYNQWQQVWQGRDELHHDMPPVSEGKYTGHKCAALDTTRLLQVETAYFYRITTSG